MSYSAYELTAGTSCLNLVEAYCRHLTEGGKFSDTSSPSLSQVESVLTQVYYRLQAHLAQSGYGTAQTLSPVVSYLEHLNAIGAVVQIELMHPISSGEREANLRYREFKAQWEADTAFLATSGFADLGAARAGQASGDALVLTGVSLADKQGIESDSDYLLPRFRRGFGMRQDLGEGQVDTDRDRPGT